MIRVLGNNPWEGAQYKEGCEIRFFLLFLDLEISIALYTLLYLFVFLDLFAFLYSHNL